MNDRPDSRKMRDIAQQSGVSCEDTDAISRAFKNLEIITDDELETGLPNTLEREDTPIRPLGTSGGSYYLIAPNGELRNMKAEALEAGRGVAALLLGMGQEVESWCTANFSEQNGGWSTKLAGRWIIEKCNEKGVFHPSDSDVRSIGIWRDKDGKAFAHCGDAIVTSGGFIYYNLGSYRKFILVGAQPIERPVFSAPKVNSFHWLRDQIEESWGWKIRFAPEIVLGWIAAAALGGFPKWRTHIYVTGGRGSGKSKLMEMTSALLGGFSGGALNDATEASLRQSRNNQARPLLIDEFEPEANSNSNSRQENLLGLLRRMSGGDGGRITRGGADHHATSFRIVGPAYLTSINHLEMEPQDRSRFVFVDLGPLPRSDDPSIAATDLESLLEWCRKNSSSFLGRMLMQSQFWDATHLRISTTAISMNADRRQADTIATILTGWILLAYDAPPEEHRLIELEEHIRYLVTDSASSSDESEGTEALDFILGHQLTLDHGIRSSIRELLTSAIEGHSENDRIDAIKYLARNDIYVIHERKMVAFRVGKTCNIARICADTKWRAGAHKSALMKLEGVEDPKHSVRMPHNKKQRVVLLPYNLF